MGILDFFIKLITKTGILFYFLKFLPTFYASSSAVGPVDDGIDGEEFPAELRRDLMPRHVAITMDGNRRWAKNRGFSGVIGYKEGSVTILNIIKLCCKWDIPIVSFYLFSSENWTRPRMEVDYLMNAFEEVLRDQLPILMSYEARIIIIGNKSSLPISLQEQIKVTEETSKNNTKTTLLLAMSYGGQNDITQACQSIATKVKTGSLEPEAITNSLFEQELQTKVVDSPYPDLLIRTSGELRISNFFLWQSAYSELYFTDVLWPDFGRAEFIKALLCYEQRGRRFGRK